MSNLSANDTLSVMEFLNSFEDKEYLRKLFRNSNSEHFIRTDSKGNIEVLSEESWETLPIKSPHVKIYCHLAEKEVNGTSFVDVEPRIVQNAQDTQNTQIKEKFVEQLQESSFSPNEESD